MAQTFIKYGPPDNPKYPKDSCGNFLHRGIFNANPNQIALIDPDKNVTISYGDLQKVTSKLAKRLKKAGIRKGDIVTIISENRTEFLVAVISTLYLGATITVLNPDYTKNELQNQLRNYTPSIIFCSKKVLERLQSLKISSEIIIFDQDFKSNGIKNYANFLQDVQDEDTGDYLEENVDVDDTAVVFTSSGTTGFPKSVQITHRNLRIFYVYLREREYGDFKDGLKSLGYLPFFHMLGLGLAFASLCSSNQLILMERFAPEKFFQNIAKYKINCMVGVPTILLFMQRTPLLDQYDCTSLSQVIYGSAPAPVEVLQKLSERLNGCSFQHVYGMTEAAGVVLMMPKERSGDKPGSVGTPVHTFVVKVCDIETGAILGPNQTGEIRIKGDGVMKGYFNDPKATQDSFDEDGFMKTGDVGYYDNDDFFYIVDRLKELIKYKSFQVPPAELESLIVNYPGVQEVVVVGKPDERAGELPTAIVVKIPNSKITEQDIVKYVSENLSVQKQLHGGVIFVDSITKTTTGKIMRKQIRDKLFSV